MTTQLLTHSGKWVDLLNPDPTTIEIEDIAHHLSLICRYAGAVPRHYSVAEHSLIMLEMAMKGLNNLTLTPLQLLHVLLHDSPEAYLGDIIRSLKAHIGFYDEYERRMLRAIFTALKVPLEKPDSHTWHMVNVLDDACLATEFSVFFPNVKLSDIGYANDFVFSAHHIHLYPPSIDVKQVYIEQFHNLCTMHTQWVKDNG